MSAADPTTPATFRGTFTQQEALPEDAVAAAVAVMQTGRLHRYNTVPGEVAEAAALEAEFAAFTGARYALAVTSGGYAMGAALRAIGAGPGTKVLSNGWTLAPVPGAIASVGAQPVFVETTEALVIDLADLADKIATSGARLLLLSHMRGHICDMDALMALCDRAGVLVIEDCAHTMGATWDGVPSGRHGRIGCYSTQTYKHINSGEGGLIVTDDAALAAKMTLISGSYMLYDRHGAGPAAEAFSDARWTTPNVSGRMDNLRAAILRPQLARLPQQVARWNALYRAVEEGLRNVPGLWVIERHPKEGIVGSSIQFRVPHRARALAAACATRGVDLKWFGAEEPVAFTSRYDSWRYAAPQSLPRTDAILEGLLDMRLPLTFSEADARTLAAIIRDEARALAA